MVDWTSVSAMEADSTSAELGSAEEEVAERAVGEGGSCAEADSTSVAIGRGSRPGPEIGRAHV